MYDVYTKEGDKLRRILTLALCLMVLAMPLFALAEAAPITKEDIDAITDNSYKTVQDYVDAFEPTLYTWFFEGEATGNTVFTLTTTGGTVSISVADAKKYQDAETGFLGTDKLEGDVLSKDARLVGVYWEDASLDKLALPRGLKLGDTKEKLQQAIGGLEFASLEPGEFEENYDETASYDLSIGSEGSDWQEHYWIDFYLNEGKLSIAQLWYEADDE